MKKIKTSILLRNNGKSIYKEVELVLFEDQIINAVCDEKWKDLNPNDIFYTFIEWCKQNHTNKRKKVHYLYFEFAYEEETQYLRTNKVYDWIYDNFKFNTWDDFKFFVRTYGIEVPMVNFIEDKDISYECLFSKLLLEEIAFKMKDEYYI